MIFNISHKTFNKKFVKILSLVIKLMPKRALDILFGSRGQLMFNT